MGAQIFLVAFASLLQNIAIINIWHIKPHWPLIILIPLMFFVKDYRAYIFLVFLSAIILKPHPVISWPIFIFIFIIIATYFLIKIIFWRAWILNLFLIIFIAIIVDLPYFFPIAIIIDLILGMGFFYLIYEKRHTF